VSGVRVIDRDAIQRGAVFAGRVTKGHACHRAACGQGYAAGRRPFGTAVALAGSEKMPHTRKRVMWRGVTMSIAIEEKRIRGAFDRAETVEDVARTLPEDDERRARLLKVSSATLSDGGAIRPVIAARLLGLSEKTVRAWAAQGAIAVAERKPRLLLDPQSVHLVSHILRELREHGKDRDLLDEVWRRLNDSALLERVDLRESIEQMRQGQGRVLRPIN
jgi:hypothetical protein